jgi:hypothetical protein
MVKCLELEVTTETTYYDLKLYCSFYFSEEVTQRLSHVLHAVLVVQAIMPSPLTLTTRLFSLLYNEKYCGMGRRRLTSSFPKADNRTLLGRGEKGGAHLFIAAQHCLHFEFLSLLF